MDDCGGEVAKMCETHFVEASGGRRGALYKSMYGILTCHAVEMERMKHFGKRSWVSLESLQ